MMKAKAEAEAKEMQAKGLKRGEDFVDCESLLSCLCPRAWCSVARSALWHFQGFRSSCVHPIACVAVLDFPLLPALRDVPLGPGLNTGGLASSPSAYGEAAKRGGTRASSHDVAFPLLSLKPMCGTPGRPLCCCEISAFGALTTITTNFANSYISAELKGNKQAEDIKAGMGSLGGLKKSL